MRLIDETIYNQQLKKQFRREKYQSDCQDWQTPDDFIEALLAAMCVEKFDFDSCCTEFNIPAEIYMTPEGTYTYCNEQVSEYHGLNANWPNGIGWMNPPYGKDLKLFMQKITEQTAHNSNISIVALLPQRFENVYYHQHVLMMASGIYLLRGKKLVFRMPGGYAADNTSQVAPQKLCLVFYNFDGDYLAQVSEKLNMSRFTGVMIKPYVLELQEIPF